MENLMGKSVIVTGGASGIGQAVSYLLGESGCSVTVADLNKNAGEDTVSHIREAGGQAQYVMTDITDEQSVMEMVNQAVTTYGRLDGACNAAGTPQRGKPLHNVELSDWDRCHNINLRGLFLCNKYQIIAMLESGKGSIVNIASTAASVGFANGSEYCASKAGVMGLVRGAAIDYAKKGIRINAVLPGGTLTPMLESAMAQDKDLESALAAVHPMGRFGQPVEIATAVRWLISDESSFATGAAFPIDGGHTAV